MADYLTFRNISIFSVRRTQLKEINQIILDIQSSYYAATSESAIGVYISALFFVDKSLFPLFPRRESCFVAKSVCRTSCVSSAVFACRFFDGSSNFAKDVHRGIICSSYLRRLFCRVFVIITFGHSITTNIVEANNHE